MFLQRAVASSPSKNCVRVASTRLLSSLQFGFHPAGLQFAKRASERVSEGRRAEARQCEAAAVRMWVAPREQMRQGRKGRRRRRALNIRHDFGNASALRLLPDRADVGHGIQKLIRRRPKHGWRGQSEGQGAVSWRSAMHGVRRSRGTLTSLGPGRRRQRSRPRERLLLVHRTTERSTRIGSCSGSCSTIVRRRRLTGAYS